MRHGSSSTAPGSVAASPDPWAPSCTWGSSSSGPSPPSWCPCLVRRRDGPSPSSPIPSMRFWWVPGLRPEAIGRLMTKLWPFLLVCCGLLLRPGIFGRKDQYPWDSWYDRGRMYLGELIACMAFLTIPVAGLLLRGPGLSCHRQEKPQGPWNSKVNGSLQQEPRLPTSPTSSPSPKAGKGTWSG